jgi:L-lactate dehydrogenase complex protein LldF
VVKGKSMLAEEVDLNRALERNGIRPLETDLGEFIVQLAGERPSHITAPALHKSRGQIASLFVERLGMPPTEDVEQITAQAREVLRRDFLTAPVGVTGVNFGVAQTGTLVVVENEGNARLSLSLPKIHVALMGIEKVVPRVHDLAVFLKLLGRSTTGQRMTSYVNLLNGPLRADESDGPAELHLVLVDNGRSRILEDRFLRQTLCCIRCGACLNICPVFQRIGGHAYGGVYPGPIGAILSPQLLSTDAAPQHAFVSSLCGACREICPVKIEIPRILLQLREQTQKGKNAKAVRVPVEKAAMQLWARATATPRAYRAAGRALKWLWRLPIPPVRKWSRKREPPSIPMLPFRDLFSAQETSIHDHGSDNVLVNDKGLDGQ